MSKIPDVILNYANNLISGDGLFNFSYERELKDIDEQILKLTERRDFILEKNNEREKLVEEIQHWIKFQQ